MRKLVFLFCVSYYFLACSDTRPVDDLPMIDVVNSIGNYQRVYCSDYFSSIELIPLETKSDCLLIFPYNPINAKFLLNDDFIFIKEKALYAFDRRGKYLHQIGQVGQGPGDYIIISDYFFDTDKPSIYINNLSRNILEYDFNGKYIRSFPVPKPDGTFINYCSYASDNLFVGHQPRNGKNKYSFCLFDKNGDTVKCFPNHHFFERIGGGTTFGDGALNPVRVDERIYLKNNISDTIYYLDNLTLHPAYIFGLGQYSVSKETLVNVRENIRTEVWKKELHIRKLTGTPKYFFYILSVSELFPRPKTKPFIAPFSSLEVSRDPTVFGIYNIEENTNVLLNTNERLEKGIINDLNGGLSFFPQYYIGNNMVADIWDAEEMKEMLTEEFFATKTIKDPQAHQELKEVLKNLKEDDNPVIVIAKLK